MTVQVEFWQLLTFLAGLLLSFLSFAFVAGKMLLSQVDRRLDQRFQAMESARETAGRHWDEKFAALLEQNKREAEGWQSLEREFLRFQADLPLNYVRREDYVRNQTVIEAKLDAVALKIENIQLKGAQR
ncbi:hypothetical protein LH427_04775 [Laribacter hongkongensis]|uniref:hypothetical protein n=1 Tax=Laribacter hongkongensis TaxID=168471 RepID=UPI001EFED153|nr:hypothetical protein [Laribacter hongkongensis]MCG8991460.1 hypothetical protein [Laribacter hongkongensis]MCG8997716.1 hypothetical protein [Laribacter hongkongensis]MCG9001258.1 hypothetical protein [Laribacter hongkongensis]MCG9003046.1 hypothetical protein [Laribacter hongkongensis]MCG9007466.1 hypothetical protein [Laribacter hongkongensis]